MKLTIVAPDKTVGVDGVFRNVPLVNLNPDIHAVQWDGETGHIELNNPIRVIQITGISAFQSFIDEWTAAAPPPPPPAPSPAEVFDDRLENDPIIRALVELIAEDSGSSVMAVRARLRLLR